MDRMKIYWNNLSIRKALIIYTIVFMLLASLLSSITIGKLGDWQSSIINKYHTFEKSLFTDNKGRQVTLTLGINEQLAEYTAEDSFLLKAIEVGKTASIPLFFGGCIILAAFLFYRNKLKKPIKLINDSAVKIAAHNLDFSLHYSSKDEMGQLCRSLEIMRASLEHNYRDMWRLMEERKRLNAAFSHDLRTPLTVLRGYSDFLSSYVPQGRVNQDKLVSTLTAISKHTSRLEKYVETMSEVQRLEDINVHREETMTLELGEQITSIASVLEKNSDRTVTVINSITDRKIYADAKLILQVLENVLANAIRYAKCRVEVKVKMYDPYLTLEVCDDGPGFSADELVNATKPYYKDQSEDPIHFGLGLYVCKILCEKHGGQLTLTNQPNGGAKVIGQFYL